MEPDTNAQVAAAALAERAVTESRLIWADVEGNDGVLMRERLLGVLPMIVRPHREAAAGLAADFYTFLRGRRRSRHRVTLAPDTTTALLSTGVYVALGPLFGPQQRFVEAQAGVEGVIEHAVLSGYRDTISTNANADPASQGWKYTTSARACDFCVDIARRHGARKSDRPFAGHDHCRCVSTPVFG